VANRRSGPAVKLGLRHLWGSDPVQGLRIKRAAKEPGGHHPGVLCQQGWLV
jgi:hypothetical protein